VPQTFTMSSGVGQYQVDANELPADDTHMDTRLGIDFNREKPLQDDLTLDYNGLVSMEFDYLAFGAGGSLAWDLNRGNTTLLGGVNLEYNRVHPVGNTPVPFASMQPAGTPQPRDVASVSKIGEEFSLGVTQVIDRYSLAQLRLTTSHFSGYLTDPYKILSVVDDQNSATLGQTVDYVFEHRPDSRTMKSIYLAYRRAFDDDVLDLGYRRYQDSWSISSDTVELGYRFGYPGRKFFKPFLRLYSQGQADFYRHSLTTSEPTPSYASADFRLASFDAITLSIELGRDLDEDRVESLSLEYYVQEGDSHPVDAVGLQRQQDLYPKLQVWLIKYVYGFRW
jgi:hypothetical protein